MAMDSVSAWRSRIEPPQIEAAVSVMLAQGWLSDRAPAVIAHDMDRLGARLGRLRALFPSSALHAVAIKANPVVPILAAVVDAGCGLEAASWEEVQLAVAAGCPPAQIVYDSPAKTRTDLAAALKLGVHINADNLDELDRLATLGAGPEASVGLRLNPALDGGTIATTSVANRGSRFGLPWPDSVPSLVQPFERYPWLTGLHVHVGSQGCPVSLLVEAARRVVELRAAIHTALGRPTITTLDIGGGLPAEYGAASPGVELDDYVSMLRAQVPALFEPDLRIVTEMGRALQVGCGFVVSRVEYVKRVAERSLATLHVGADLLLRTAYAPTDWPHEVLVLDAHGRLKSGPVEPWTLVGPLCFAGDVIARDRSLPAVEEGDLVVVRDVGGYTLGMWSRHCSRGAPAVVGLRGTPPRLEPLRPAETSDDIVRSWGG
ncbi:MAG: diaminopimelate decarboxylase [Deltaproteobacteria bacterium]|nr:diaminopimelate decarboxylase [Deltaproteobacteria bacterium]